MQDLPLAGSQPNNWTRFDRSEIDQSITNRFEKIVACSPGHVAVKENGGRELTYDELNRAANGVAHCLLRLRGTVAEPVGLLLDHDDRAIRTVFGVLKAGKFYVPLDPSYPPERLSFVLNDCPPGILVADSEYLSLAKKLAPPRCAVVHVGELHDGAGVESPGVAIAPDALAAVFYTSGSTGGPKGVMQSHRSVLHRVMVNTNRFGIHAQDRLSLLSSPSYSVSLRHLFGALLTGASICPFNVAFEGLAALAAWLSRERITVYFSVPTVFRQLIGSLDGTEQFTSLRVFELGGEAVTRGDFELYKKHLPASCVFVNLLGSNEAGVLRIYVADKTTQFSGAIVPIGYEVEDKEILILDDHGRKAKPGHLGQIAVRSRFLSPGYWGQPELTAAAFRPDPTDEQKQIYYTGDIGALLPDGCLIYKGRKDFRTKIRGIRVETEEIEAALRLHPSILQAAVVTHQGPEGDARLVAYVAPNREARVTVSELRAFIARKLPGPMIPASFMFLGALPLLPNGKVDRRALAPPDQARPQLDGAFVGPRDELEQRLTKLCESLLGVSPIGVCDDLFDIGIDSLGILRLIAQIEAGFARQLAPATLFHSPTIAQLAAILRKETAADTSSLVPIQTAGTKPPFFWIHGDFSSVVLSRHLGSDQPFYALDHQSQDGRPALYTDIETIARHYLAQLQKVQAKGPYFVGGYSFGGVVALEVSQQIARQGERVALLALLDPASPVPRDSQPSRTAAMLSESPRASIADDFRRHAGNLARLEWKDRFAYIRPRAAQKAAKMLGLPAVDRAAKTAVYRASLALKFRLPVFVRSRYILDVYTSAQDQYRPQPCSTRAILFKGADRRDHWESDWEEVLVGDCEQHVVNAGHQQIREAPYVHLWAETLKDALSRAQGETRPFASAVPGIAGNAPGPRSR